MACVMNMHVKLVLLLRLYNCNEQLHHFLISYTIQCWAKLLSNHVYTFSPANDTFICVTLNAYLFCLFFGASMRLYEC